jgi:hypothetical protein
MTFRDCIVVREIDVRALVQMLLDDFEALVPNVDLQAHGQAPSYSQRVYDKSHIMFVSKNFARTSIR